MKELPDIEQLRLLSHRQQVLYALKAAKLVTHLTTIPEAKEAIATAERWLEGKFTEEECKVAARVAYASTNAAYIVSNATASNASYAAANASYAAYATASNASYIASNAVYYAAYYAARADPSVKQQLVDYYQYLVTMNERVWKMLTT